MNATFRISNQSLTRLELPVVRQRLFAMREELMNRSGGLDLIRRKQVDSAIRKLDKGGFGVCESCARPILKVRLLEIPYARYCISCF